MANAAQIKIIHTLKGKKTLNLEDGEYRAMLSAYGVEKSTELSNDQARELIDRMTKMAVSCGVWKKKEGAKKYDHLADREPEMATPAQLRMIDGMWAEVSYAPAEKQAVALRRFLFTIAKASDLRFLTQVMVRKVVRALKAMKASRAQKQASKAA